MSAGRWRMGMFLTEAEKLARGIWPWEAGIRARLPQHYKKRYMEFYQKEPIPVHYRPDPAKYTVTEFGERLPVQNIPIPITYPAECDQGLWGGEGIIMALHRRNDNEYKPAVPKMWKPRIVKRIFYSEILDKWMGITVTPRTLDLVDEAFGFDFYILKTHAIDLRSLLGMRLKREMLLTLARKSMYPDNPEKCERIYNKYKEFVIPEEEADWIGLTLYEAECKQEELEEEQQKASVRPLKEVYMEKLLYDLRQNKVEGVESGSSRWLSKLNPFVSDESDQKS